MFLPLTWEPMLRYPLSSQTKLIIWPLLMEMMNILLCLVEIYTFLNSQISQTMAWILDEYSKFHGHSPAVVTGKPIVSITHPKVLVIVSTQ